MEAIKTSSATLPEAMTRGVEKNGWRIIGPGGGGALYIPTIHPNNPDFALLSCDMTGAYRTENGGQTWTEINLKARPFAFAFDPSHPATVYAGATGLYRSDDGGYAWRLIFPRPGQVERETFLGDHAEHEYVSRDNWPGGSVQAICVDPQDSRRIFLGIRSPALRLFSSSDAGESWIEIGQVEGSQFRKTCLVATPTGQQWFILTDQRLACFDLQSSSLKDLAMPAPEVLDLAGGLDPSGAPVLYATTPGGWEKTFNAGVYRSADLGQTWEAVGSGLDTDLAHGQFRQITCIAACAEDARVVYASAVEPPRGTQAVFGILKSTDMGRSWGWSLKIGETNPANRGVGWIEKDYATDWGGAPFYLSVCPTNPRVCYATDWGTAYRTVDGGASWQQLYCAAEADGAVTTRGLDVTNIYWITFDPFDREHMALACTDIGAFHSHDGGKTWKHNLKGVPSAWVNGCYKIVFDPEVPGRAWSAWSDCHDLPRPKMFNTRHAPFQGGVCMSDDGLQSWKTAGTGLPRNCIAVDLLLDPASPVEKRTLYLASLGAGVFKSNDGGRTWQEKNQGISGSLNAWRLIRLPDGMLLLLVCRGLKGKQVIDGALYTSNDGAEGWQLLALPGGVNFPNDLAFDPGDPNRLYLACWPTLEGEVNLSGGLYRSEDRGETWANVFDSSSHVYGVSVDPHSPSTVILTTFEGAIYRSDDRGDHWRRLEGYNFKWAKQPIFDPYNPGMLYVTTFGSSVWYGPAEGVPGAAEDIRSY